MEIALQEREELFRQMTESIEEVFWIQTPDSSEVLYVSPAYEKIWGRSRESLYQEPFSFLDGIHPNDQQGVIKSLKESMLRQQIEHDDAFAAIITNSPGMEHIFRYVEAIADSPESVLITGETGVGKGLVAEAVHHLSGRRGEFVAVNVAGLDDTMFSDTEGVREIVGR